MPPAQLLIHLHNKKHPDIHKSRPTSEIVKEKGRQTDLLAHTDLNLANWENFGKFNNRTPAC